MSKEKIIIRHVHYEEDDTHGGSWKVAFADFAIAMMALFMVLWLVAATNETQKKAISHYFSSPGIFKKPSSRNPISMQGATSIMEGTQNLIKMTPTGKSGFETAGEESPGIDELQALSAQLTKITEARGKGGMRRHLKIQSIPSGFMVSLVEAAHGPAFESGSSALQPFYEDLLLLLAPWLKKLSHSLLIVGHSDSSGQNIPEYRDYNWMLAAERAETVRQTLVFGGVPYKQVIGTSSVSSLVTLPGYQEDNPLNRRVDILILSAKSNRVIQKQRQKIKSLTQTVSEDVFKSMSEAANINQKTSE